ncbi:MAG: nitrite reductase small subunit NirD [Nitrospinae bacterium]|nr:nitrite reductase small subunit NirD [Nitrospinota bacterium]
MIKFIKVLKAEDLPIGKSAIILVGGLEIAVFNYKNEYFAILNKCPHKGGPLGEGRVQEGIVICPNHEWRFELKTGNSMQNPEMKVKIFPVRIKDEKIYVGFDQNQTKILGKEASALPASLKFKIPTILKPINPEEEL